MTDAAQLQNDTALAEIAVQPVGQTGYTAVFDESAITHFHVDPNTVGLDMTTLSERFPDFWAIFAASLDGSLADGYYDWEDEDGVIRSKFMSIYPVGDTRLRVASTTYIDEFSQPVVELSSQLTDVQEKARNQFLIILAGTVLVAAGSATVLSRQFSLPIREITEATRHIKLAVRSPLICKGGRMKSAIWRAASKKHPANFRERLTSRGKT